MLKFIKYLENEKIDFKKLKDRQQKNERKYQEKKYEAISAVLPLFNMLSRWETGKHKAFLRNRCPVTKQELWCISLFHSELQYNHQFQSYKM